MKKYAIIIAALFYESCNAPVGNKIPEPVTAASINYTKEDLVKIKWIEGSWKGMDDDKPFYENYTFLNDSTISTVSYEWNGKDSSKSFADRLYWQNGMYYLGATQDWAVQSITDSAIKMLPNNSRIHNDITWKRTGSGGWDAILVAPKGTKIYHMQRFDPFKK